MQGLNFLAALILLKVEDQTLAFVILVRILQKDGWRHFYTDGTPKLFEVSKVIRKFLQAKAPKLAKKIK
jgi:hypothetical protein